MYSYQVDVPHRDHCVNVLKKSNEVELKDLLQLDQGERKVILIEGPPGSGKTTLAWHICQEWESKNLYAIGRIHNLMLHLHSFLASARLSAFVLFIFTGLYIHTYKPSAVLRHDY